MLVSVFTVCISSAVITMADIDNPLTSVNALMEELNYCSLAESNYGNQWGVSVHHDGNSTNPNAIVVTLKKGQEYLDISFDPATGLFNTQSNIAAIREILGTAYGVPVNTLDIPAQGRLRGFRLNDQMTVGRVIFETAKAVTLNFPRRYFSHR
jgi:hypothetical protein